MDGRLLGSQRHTRLGGHGDVTPNPVISFGGGDAFAFASYIPLQNTISTDPKGWGGGIEIGYNRAFGRFVFGVVTDYSWLNISGTGSQISTTPVAGFPGFSVNSMLTTREALTTFGTVRGKAGYVLPLGNRNGSVLLYGTGGFAYGHAASDFAVSQTVAPFGIPAFTPSWGSGSATLTGWTGGGGVDWACGHGLRLGLEYLHYDLGTLDNPARTIWGINAAGTTFSATNVNPSAEFKGNMLRLRGTWNLGQPLKF
jgi:outer membrane immunogenic protein